ncbi:MAG TPA: transcriptional regulator [Saprospiraceae bacterium]|nr:transcriptional regulator [Saprospiraceae bacterium]
MFKKLNPLLHAQLRLKIISLLVKEGQSDFVELKEKTKATSGNLSIQLKKLEEAEYVRIEKGYKDNYPHTSVRITSTGLQAFEEYVEALKDYFE